MRTAHRALVIVTALVASGCATAPNPLVGAWVVENYTGERVDPAARAGSAAGRSVKILTRDRFAFGAQTARGAHSGGGRYEWNDGVYRETVEYHSIPALVGRTIEFECEIDGEVWYHRAAFDAGGRHFVIREAWRRIDGESRKADPPAGDAWGLE